MKAGALRHYITIEQSTESFDANGELVNTWADYVSLWASIEPLVGREYFTAKQFSAETTGKLRMRYFAGITAKMRIKFGTRYFNITGISNIEERNKEIVIYYQEVI